MPRFVQEKTKSFHSSCCWKPDSIVFYCGWRCQKKALLRWGGTTNDMISHSQEDVPCMAKSFFLSCSHQTQHGLQEIPFHFRDGCLGWLVHKLRLSTRCHDNGVLVSQFHFPLRRKFCVSRRHSFLRDFQLLCVTNRRIEGATLNEFKLHNIWWRKVSVGEGETRSAIC